MAKSKYTNESKNIAQKLASEGLTDKQIYLSMGIGHDTFYTYIKKYPEFSEALKKGKQQAIAKVENALFQKACGFKITLETPNGSKEQYIHSDTAAIFFLKNRDPENWKDRQDIEHSGDLKIKIIKD